LADIGITVVAASGRARRRILGQCVIVVIATKVRDAVASENITGRPRKC